MSEFIQNNKKSLIIALIIVLLIATVSTVFALQPKQEPVVPLTVSSEVVSSEPTSSVTVSVPEIAKPSSTTTSSAESSEPASSKATSSVAVSSTPAIDITASVDSKPQSEPKKAESSAPTSSAAVESKPQTPPEGDLMPQPNPDYAKPANRNMPSFTVDSSVMGPSGRYHGEFDGESYYHAGLDSWVDEFIWFAWRFGQHPTATQADLDSCGANQRSPFQQDGDFKPNTKGGVGTYYCAACKGWVKADAWENGKHGSGKNHIANTKKMG